MSGVTTMTSISKRGSAPKEPALQEAPRTPSSKQGSGVAMPTGQPSNASELQLYNVLKRANLLQYFETFIAQGGDDVQQLCEAGEDEFLEIMALVGMAAKPLHVRRLQKALQEWVANPAAWEASARSGFPLTALSGPAPGSISAVVRDNVSSLGVGGSNPASVVTAATWTPQAPSRSLSPADSLPSPASASNLDVKEERSGSPLLQPVLLDSQIAAIAVAAATLGKQLPYFEPKDLNAKKPVNREIQNLVTSAESTPNKIEELRKYAAIYGRFDSKRRNDRPMSLHEISVNEAAAQLCLHCPTLLTRREDLFPLARQVVRDSGYQYSKGHSRAAEVVLSAKKGRLDPSFQRHFDISFKGVKQELDKDQEERVSAAFQELTSIQQHQEQVKAELLVAREEQDLAQSNKLQRELQSLQAQQLQVLHEHSDLLARPRNTHRSKQNKPDDQGTGGGSGTSSPASDTDSFNCLASATFDSLYAAIRSSKGTLFEEGLRIAEQYGMADFALELHQLQSQRHLLEAGPDNNNSRHALPKVLEGPFELQELTTPFHSPHHSPQGDPLSGSGSGSGVKGQVKTCVENGVQTMEVAALVSSPSLPLPLPLPRPDLKRKGDNLEALPSRPPSRRNRANQNGGLA